MIFDWHPWERSFLRYSMLPFGRQVLNDWRYCLAQREFGYAFYSPFFRSAQFLGRRAGFIDGLKEKKYHAKDIRASRIPGIQQKVG